MNMIEISFKGKVCLIFRNFKHYIYSQQNSNAITKNFIYHFGNTLKNLKDFHRFLALLGKTEISEYTPKSHLSISAK